MLEFFLCSMVTLLPDYLYRRYGQGKRIGHEITVYSVWFELRWGIASCAILTISLITLIFYYHPASTSVNSFFRTVTVLPEKPGRVVEIMVENDALVEAGAPLFRLDDSAQRAEVEAASTQIVEVEAAMVVAQSELASALGTVNQAQGALEQAIEELETKVELRERNPDVVREREIEQLQNVVDSRQGAVEAAQANQSAVQSKIDTLLPAQKKSAEARLEAAQVDLDKTVIYAGVSGRISQFALQRGDFVSPLLRPAALLLPTTPEHRFQAGFSQLAAQIIKPGMVTEVVCATKPFTIVPMVVERVQEVIAAGQFRPSDQLLDPQDRDRPGTVTVIMRPLSTEQAADILPGSKCIANAYTDNHALIESGEVSGLEKAFLHTVDTVGLAHALILRIQALMMPVQTLVLSGEH